MEKVAKDASNFRVDSAGLSKIVATFVEVPRDMWQHDFSHVAGYDRTGTARFSNGREAKWLVRPGGLATLTWGDGRVTYLASCPSNVRAP